MSILSGKANSGLQRDTSHVSEPQRLRLPLATSLLKPDVSAGAMPRKRLTRTTYLAQAETLRIFLVIAQLKLSMKPPLVIIH